MVRSTSRLHLSRINFRLWLWFGFPSAKVRTHLDLAPSLRLKAQVNKGCAILIGIGWVAQRDRALRIHVALLVALLIRGLFRCASGGVEDLQVDKFASGGFELAPFWLLVV